MQREWNYIKQCQRKLKGKGKRENKKKCNEHKIYKNVHFNSTMSIITLFFFKELFI